MYQITRNFFLTGMKDKWEERVYVELYAGAGYSKIRDRSRSIVGSPSALTLSTFDKYIFCEETANNLEALKFRVEQKRPLRSWLRLGDCNQRRRF